MRYDHIVLRVCISKASEKKCTKEMEQLATGISLLMPVLVLVQKREKKSRVNTHTYLYANNAHKRETHKHTNTHTQTHTQTHTNAHSFTPVRTQHTPTLVCMYFLPFARVVHDNV